MIGFQTGTMDLFLTYLQEIGYNLCRHQVNTKMKFRGLFRTKCHLFATQLLTDSCVAFCLQIRKFIQGGNYERKLYERKTDSAADLSTIL